MAVKKSFQVFVFVVALAASYAVVTWLKQGVDNTLTNKQRAEMVQPPLPDVTFRDAAGNKVMLRDFRGRVVLVNLWATWCPPCVAELPSLDILQAKLKDKNFKVLAISLDRGVSMDKIKAFLDEHDIENLTPYWDENRDITMKWKYDGIPSSFLLDRSGNVLMEYQGGLDWASGNAYDDVMKAVE